MRIWRTWRVVTKEGQFCGSDESMEAIDQPRQQQ